jgi:hypothetical protein
MTPTTEEIATAFAARCRPEPVQRWELPALVASVQDEARDAWNEEGQAIATDPDPDYGKDIDGESDDDHEEDDDDSPF